MKLSQAIEGFTLARTGTLSPRTITDYRFYLQLWCDQAGDCDLAAITQQHLQRWLAWLATEYRTVKGKPLGQSGRRHGWTAIRAFWAWASQDLGVDNVSAAIPGPQVPPSAVVPLTRDNIEALMRAIDHSAWAKTEDRSSFRYQRAEAARDRALLLVLLDTGVRVSELCRLNVQDADLRNRTLEIRVYRSSAKGRPRTIPLTGRTCAALWRYLADRQEAAETITRDTPLFTASRGPKGAGGRLGRRAINQLLQRLGDRANVQDCHPHRFRHTFAVEYLRGGGNPWMLKHLLGHGSMQMVDRYLHFVGEDYQAAHQRASAVERWRL